LLFTISGGIKKGKSQKIRAFIKNKQYLSVFICTNRTIAGLLPGSNRKGRHFKKKVRAGAGPFLARVPA